MNWDTIKGQWGQLTGKIREKWGDLTDDEVAQMKGQRDQLVGKIQEKCGRTKEEAEQEVDSSSASRKSAAGRLHPCLGSGPPEPMDTRLQTSEGSRSSRNPSGVIAWVVVGLIAGFLCGRPGDEG